MKFKVRPSGLARLLATSFALGAGVAYFFDERSGGRRRALVRDKFVHFRNELRSATERELHDLGNRTRGFLKDAKHVLANEPVADDVLIERVRARLGHVCSHARTIQVNAKGNGVIELRGPIDPIERPKVLTALRLVPGVRGIDDDLDARTSLSPGM